VSSQGRCSLSGGMRPEEYGAEVQLLKSLMPGSAINCLCGVVFTKDAGSLKCL
jgi:hypothetical protein